MENKKQEVVSRLWKMGMSLIPMSGKTPCEEWAEFQERQPTAKEICQWSKNRFLSKRTGKYWSAKILNWALITGKISGIVVVDTDDFAAEDMVGTLVPETPLIQRTGRGGMHRVYRWKESISNSSKMIINNIKYNIDIRGDGGYIMAPESIHPETNKSYKEKTKWTSELIKEAPFFDPNWFPESSIKTKKETKYNPTQYEENANIELPMEERLSQASRYIEKCPGAVQGLGADNYCFALSLTLLHGFALNPEEAEELLYKWGIREDQKDSAGLHYPWDYREIEHKIKSAAIEKYKGKVGDKLFILNWNRKKWAEAGDRVMEFLKGTI